MNFLIIKKLYKIYKKIDFSYRYFFILSFISSLLLSFFEGLFLGTIFNLTNTLLGNDNENISFFGNLIFSTENANHILILCALIIIGITLLKILPLCITEAAVSSQEDSIPSM